MFSILISLMCNKHDFLNWLNLLMYDDLRDFYWVFKASIVNIFSEILLIVVYATKINVTFAV